MHEFLEVNCPFCNSNMVFDAPGENEKYYIEVWVCENCCEIFSIPVEEK